MTSKQHFNDHPHEFWLSMAAASSVAPGQWLKLIDRQGMKWVTSRFMDNRNALISSFGKVLDTAQIEQKLDAARQWLSASEQHSLIDISSPLYPEQLKQLTHPPLVLFVSGRVSLLTQPQIAIVGSRRASVYGVKTAQKIAHALTKHNLVITSGLAQGIDGAAHKGALDHGKTIAVVGHGLHQIYPAKHKALANELLRSGGAIVSEFFPGTPPRPYHFPQRNRIIAALSIGTLVVEAAIKSGTLITANLAADLGKEVFAIPGNVHDPNCEGSNALIKDGAILVRNADDILAEFPEYLTLVADNTVEDEKSDSNRLASCKILASVEFEVTACDVIAERSDLPVCAVMAKLLEYELRGLVATVPGGYIKLRGK